MEEEKDFWRFYIDSSKGRLDKKDGKPTVESMKARAEAFYRAFKVETKTEIATDQRSEIYHVVGGFSGVEPGLGY